MFVFLFNMAVDFIQINYVESLDLQSDIFNQYIIELFS